MARAKAPVLPSDTMEDNYPLETHRATPGAAKRLPFVHEQAATTPQPAGDLKSRASATTLYLMPGDHERLRIKAIREGKSFQSLVLDALDLLLQQDGEAPVERWDTRRKQR